MITFELCAETLHAALAAKPGGADRIELCSALREGGLTSSHALIREVIRSSGLPVYILLRPRGGDFVYSPAEVEIIAQDLVHARQLGAAGVVLGLLRGDGRVDRDATRDLVKLAGSLEVTFHRAFDLTPSLEEALEEVIDAGCRRVLTSGGASDVAGGALRLHALVKQAGPRIDVAVGGGLTLSNAAQIARVTGASHFHGSVRGATGAAEQVDPFRSAPAQVLSSEIRSLLDRLHEGQASTQSPNAPEPGQSA